jgi:hypothetical protein
MRILLLLLAGVLPASGMLYNIDQPIPMSLAHAEYYIGIRLWGQGGGMARFGIGLFDRVTLGASYGGDRLIGAADPVFYDRPAFFARGAILLEQGYFPDLVVGFNNQGLDNQVGNEYDIMPKGGFLSLGKTIEPTRTYVQGGVNYWGKVNGFAVVNQLLPGGFELMVEYDLGANDNRTDGVGYLNAGLAWTFNEQIRFGVAVRDMLGNRDASRFNRVVDLSFHDLF